MVLRMEVSSADLVSWDLAAHGAIGSYVCTAALVASGFDET